MTTTIAIAFRVAVAMIPMGMVIPQKNLIVSRPAAWVTIVMQVIPTVGKVTVVAKMKMKMDTLVMVMLAVTTTPVFPSIVMIAIPIVRPALAVVRMVTKTDMAVWIMIVPLTILNVGKVIAVRLSVLTKTAMALGLV